MAFKSIYLSHLLFYHRVTSCFVRHKRQSGRPVQVLSLVCQLLIASFCLSLLYSTDYFDFKQGMMHPAPIILTIILMRFVYLLFVIMENLQTNYKRWNWRAFMIILCMFCVSIQFLIELHYSAQKEIFAIWIIELLVFDTVLTPLANAVMFAGCRLRRLYVYTENQPHGHTVKC